MRGVLTGLLLAVLLAGCETATTPWVRGTVTPGLPRRTEKFPSDVAFCVAKTEKRVKAAFEEALRARNPDGKAPLLVYRRLTGF